MSPSRAGNDKTTSSRLARAGAGAYAFWGSTALSAANFLGNAPALGEGAFGSVAPGFMIYSLSSSLGPTNHPHQ